MVALSVALAFVFGYSLTLLPLLRAKIALGAALGLAFASDTLSITVMEIIDNALMLIIPGAMEAGLASMLFWGSMMLSLLLAGLAVFPLNRWLIGRGRGHAVVHEYHGRHASPAKSESEKASPAGTHASHHAHHFSAGAGVEDHSRGHRLCGVDRHRRGGHGDFGHVFAP